MLLRMSQYFIQCVCFILCKFNFWLPINVYLIFLICMCGMWRGSNGGHVIRFKSRLTHIVYIFQTFMFVARLLDTHPTFGAHEFIAAWNCEMHSWKFVACHIFSQLRYVPRPNDLPHLFIPNANQTAGNEIIRNTAADGFR